MVSDLKRLTGFGEDRQKYLIKIYFLIKIFNIANALMELCSRDQEEDWLIESGSMGENIPEQMLLVLSLKGGIVHVRCGECQAKGFEVGSWQEVMRVETRK